jgi:hypothetical protein
VGGASAGGCPCLKGKRLQPQGSFANGLAMMIDEAFICVEAFGTLGIQ